METRSAAEGSKRCFGQDGPIRSIYVEWPHDLISIRTRFPSRFQWARNQGLGLSSRSAEYWPRAGDDQVEDNTIAVGSDQFVERFGRSTVHDSRHEGHYEVVHLRCFLAPRSQP